MDASLAQAEMGARLAVPRRRMGVVGILSIGLAVLTGCLLGIPAVRRSSAARDAGVLVVVLLAVAWAACCSGPGCSTR